MKILKLRRHERLTAADPSLEPDLASSSVSKCVFDLHFGAVSRQREGSGPLPGSTWLAHIQLFFQERSFPTLRLNSSSAKGATKLGVVPRTRGIKYLSENVPQSGATVRRPPVAARAPGKVCLAGPVAWLHVPTQTPLDRTLSREATAPRLVSERRELMPEHCVFVRTQTANLLPCAIHENVRYFELVIFSKTVFFDFEAE